MLIILIGLTVILIALSVLLFLFRRTYPLAHIVIPVIMALLTILAVVLAAGAPGGGFGTLALFVFAAAGDGVLALLGLIYAGSRGLFDEGYPAGFVIRAILLSFLGMIVVLYAAVYIINPHGC